MTDGWFELYQHRQDQESLCRLQTVVVFGPHWQGRGKIYQQSVGSWLPGDVDLVTARDDGHVEGRTNTAALQGDMYLPTNCFQVVVWTILGLHIGCEARVRGQGGYRRPTSSYNGGGAGGAGGGGGIGGLLEGVELNLLDAKLIGLGYVREDLVRQLCHQATQQIIWEGVQR